MVAGLVPAGERQRSSSEQNRETQRTADGRTFHHPRAQPRQENRSETCEIRFSVPLSTLRLRLLELQCWIAWLERKAALSYGFDCAAGPDLKLLPGVSTSRTEERAGFHTEFLEVVI